MITGTDIQNALADVGTAKLLDSQASKMAAILSRMIGETGQGDGQAVKIDSRGNSGATNGNLAGSYAAKYAAWRKAQGELAPLDSSPFDCWPFAVVARQTPIREKILRELRKNKAELETGAILHGIASAVFEAFGEPIDAEAESNLARASDARLSGLLAPYLTDADRERASLLMERKDRELRQAQRERETAERIGASIRRIALANRQVTIRLVVGGTYTLSVAELVAHIADLQDTLEQATGQAFAEVLGKGLGV